MLNDENVTPPVGFAPPTQPGEILISPRPSSWPTVIGVIAIVFGSLGALQGVWGLLMPLFAGFLQDMTPPGTIGAEDMLEQLGGWVMLSSGLTVGLGVLLLVAGIGLVRRRARAVRTIRTWAVFKFVFVVANVCLSYYLQQEQFEEMARQGAGGPPAAIMGSLIIVGVVFNILWGWALPVFSLIWFSRGRIKEETSQWQ